MKKFDFSYIEVSKMLAASKDVVESNENYRLLYKGFFQSFWDSLLSHENYFSILISPCNLEKLNFMNLSDKLNSIKIEYLKENNYLIIDEYGDVIESTFLELDNDKMINRLREDSCKYYVFFFGENGITRFLYGNEVETVNPFYTIKERKKYFQRKDISQFKKVLQEYEEDFVSKQVHYMCLFADNSILHQAGIKNLGENILKNKPEKFMRDQLCEFLNQNMLYEFFVEGELSHSKKKMDIYFDVSGEFYFIEIKWLGKSINDTGDGISTEYSDPRARDGVSQTLEYIKELKQTRKNGVRCGYLLIYDAREEKKDIDYKGFSFVDAELKPYMDYFECLSPIKITKRHSA